MAKVLVVDDAAFMRVRAAKVLRDAGHEVLEAENGQEAVNKYAESRPDVVLMDITMPQLDGIEATRQIRSQNDAIKVLVLTMHDNEDVFFRSISAGASGYVLKRSGGLELMSAIRSTHEGNSYLSPLLAKALMSDYLQRGERTQDGPAQGRRLSAREQEILKLIAEGNSSREIAEMLDLSVKTVHNHRTRLMTKLDIHRNTDLVKYAIRLGMVQVD